jgi:hypothetical protein
VGPGVGILVGYDVTPGSSGLLVGARDGDFVGTFVGSTVGLSVGEEVGPGVGILVG